MAGYFKSPQCPAQVCVFVSVQKGFECRIWMPFWQKRLASRMIVNQVYVCVLCIIHIDLLYILIWPLALLKVIQCKLTHDALLGKLQEAHWTSLLYSICVSMCQSLVLESMHVNLYWQETKWKNLCFYFRFLPCPEIQSTIPGRIFQLKKKFGLCALLLSLTK